MTDLNYILNPGGLLQEIMEFIERNSAVSIPLFNLGAAITFLGTVCGQKVQTETGLRTNIYSIALGYSGSGKNAPFGTLPLLCNDNELQSFLAPTELTSSAALIKWLSLENNQVALSLVDEIGLLLDGVKNPNSFASDLPRTLIKLFSATNRSEVKGYASGDIIYLPWHHFSFYGASTPERFWGALNMSDVTDGFLARILLWEDKRDAPLPKSKIERYDNVDLKKKLNKIFSIENKNIFNIPNPIIVPQTKEANRIFLERSQHFHILKNKHKTNSYGFPSIYSRVAEHIAKIALIHSISEYEQPVEIDIKSMEWSIAVVEFLTSNMIEQMEQNIAENGIERLKQKILRWIKDNRKEGTTLRDIQRHVGRELLADQLKKIIYSLVLAEELKEEKTCKTIKYIIFS